MSIGTGYCEGCQTQVATRRQSPPHLAFAVIASALMLLVFSAWVWTPAALAMLGVWLAAWAVSAVRPRARRCERCGRRVTAGSSPRPMAGGSFVAKCLACGNGSPVADEKRGRTIPCGHCGESMVAIPAE